MRNAGSPIAIPVFAMALVFSLSAAFCEMTHALEAHSASKNQDDKGYLAAEMPATNISAEGVVAWKEEFGRICAKTGIATSLSTEQLRQLISDSDVLLEILRDIEDPSAKVYMLRLKNCQDFYNFTLEWQKKEREKLKP